MTVAADQLPLVSVVTPTFNRAGLLEETIDSVMSQDYPRLEHIVVDDGSTDDTPAILDRYAKQYGDRFRCLAHPNMGEQKSVNRGIGAARGEYLVVVNSDDPLRPDAIAALVRAIEADPGLVAVYPDWIMIDEDGAALQTVETEPFDHARMLVDHHCIPGPGALVRTDALRRVNGRDARYRYVGDLDLWLRLAEIGPFARVPEPLATWRGHPDAATHRHMGRRMALEHVAVIRAAFERGLLPPALRSRRGEAMSWAHYAAAYHAGPAWLTRFTHIAIFAVRHPPNAFGWWCRTGREKPGRSRARLIVDRLRGRVHNTA